MYPDHVTIRDPARATFFGDVDVPRADVNFGKFAYIILSRTSWSSRRICAAATTGRPKKPYTRDLGYKGIVRIRDQNR